MSTRPDLAAGIAKNLAFWANHQPEAEWKPGHTLERIRHEEGERLNARTMDKFFDREADEGDWFEGEAPALTDWAPGVLDDYTRRANARMGDAQIDADAMADIEAADWEARWQDNRRIEAELQTLHTFRESTYVRHCRNRTGEEISDEASEKSQAETAQLEEDSIELALRLESADRPALGTGPQTFIVGMLTGEQKACVNVKKRAILPTVAAEKRAPVIKALEFLLSQPAHKYDQFCTFTHGKRVPIDPVSAGWELREAFGNRKTGLHRRLSSMSAAPFMALYGASMLGRFSETGSLKDKKGELVRDAQGRVTAHPHSHVLINFKRFLSRNHDDLLGKNADAVRDKLGEPSRIKRHPMGAILMVYTAGRIYLNRNGVVIKTSGEMGEWTRCVWDFWGAHWSIDGAIEKVREACKYVVKPTDQKALSVAELAALDIALFRLHRVQPMGELRDYMRTWKETCLKPRKERRREGAESVLKVVVLPDWNARKRDRKETLAVRRRKKLRAQLRKAKKRAQREMLAEENAERHAVWLKAHAKHIEKYAQGELFGPPMPPPPPAPVPLLALPVIAAQRPAKAPTAFRNRIVARLAPAFYFGPISQPALMVWSDQPLTKADIDGMLSQPFVKPAIDACRDQFAAAVARRRARPPEVRVHTSPVTVWAENPRPAFLPALLKPSTWEKEALCEAN